MFFSLDTRLLYKNKKHDYVISELQCIDIIYNAYFIKTKDDDGNDAVLSLTTDSDVVLKQYILSTDDLKCSGGNALPSKLYTGDIVSINIGKLTNNYELIVSDGKIKGREIKSNIIVNILNLLNNDRAIVTLTNKHMNSEGELIEYKIDPQLG